MNQNDWTKSLLESIYMVWISILNFQIKTKHASYQTKLAEYAINLFEDAQLQGISPSGVMYKTLIEILCYCEMNDRALQISNSILLLQTSYY